ncbi:hypothetical protein Hanom_Chr06g00568741 [Helianthus anomalus]
MPLDYVYPSVMYGLDYFLKEGNIKNFNVFAAILLVNNCSISNGAGRHIFARLLGWNSRKAAQVLDEVFPKGRS